MLDGILPCLEKDDDGLELYQKLDRRSSHGNASNFNVGSAKKKYLERHNVHGGYMSGSPKVYEFDVIVIEDETGGYVVSIPALPGCHSQGETIDDALKNIKEAAELYLETMTDEERSDLQKQKFVGIQRVKALA